MTTTAEKIRVMQAFDEGKEVEIYCSGNRWMKDSDPSWNWQDSIWRIKPADPEPLEFWVALTKKGELAGVARAQNVLIDATHGDIDQVFVRQVTPQDEQDRLDAARYRKHKELMLNPDLWWFQQPTEWDEMIDKAMEEG